MKINRAKFYEAFRASPLTGGRITQMTVDCANGILDAAEEYGIDEIEHLSVIFGQCHHESGNRLASIKETVYAGASVQNPSDEVVANRLEAAFRKGQLTWVKTPYWRADENGQHWFGRSLIQLTHKANYIRLGKEIGVDLGGNPDLALRPDIAGKIAVVGMKKGLFTGVKLSDCKTRADYRRIVNGDWRDQGLQRKLSGLYDQYAAVIKKAAYE